MSLQLVGNIVYVAFASHADFRPYHGWVIGFDKTTLQPTKVFNTAPNADGVAIWESGGGLSFDAQGFMYFATGNGFQLTGGFSAFDPAHGNYSESVLKIDTTPNWSPTNPQMMTVADYFTPFNWQTLDSQDADLGSGGVILLPDGVGSTAHQHVLVETGKQGKIYLLDRDSLGKNSADQATENGKVVQEVTAGQTGVWGNPSFYQIDASDGILYYHGSGDVLKGYYVHNGHIEDGSLPTDRAILKSSFSSKFPGTQPVISADATANPTNPVNGIVWELQVDNAVGRIQGVADNTTAGPVTLRAFNPTNLSQELYDSGQTGQRDLSTGSVKFTVPVVTNGHVLVAGADHFAVFGLFPAATTLPAAPSGLSGQGKTTPTGPQIQLSWTNPSPNTATGIKILRSTDNINFTQIDTVSRTTTTYTDVGPFKFGQLVYYKVVATNQIGDSAASNTVSVQAPLPPAVLTVTGTGAALVELSWTSVANDHFDIERSSDGTNFTKVATVPASQTTYVDTGLTTAGLYDYRIHAFNTNPNADSLSNVVGAWVGSMIDHSTPATGGFTNATDLVSNGSAGVTTNLLELTNAANQAGSTFSDTRFTVGKFTTTFDVRLHEGTQPDYADGFAFVIQPNSPTALGSAAAGLGYQGISPSVAVVFSTFKHTGDPSTTSVGLALNGAAPKNPVDTTPSGLMLNSQDAKQIDLSYDGTTLTVKITDILQPQLVFTTSFTVNIPQVITSDTAYMGLTGSSGSGGFWELEDVLSWKFTSQVALPGAPTNLRVAAYAASEIDLAWDPNSFNETGFQVERSTDGVNFTQIATTTVPSYKDTGLASGTHYYRVRAVNAAGNSPYSNTLQDPLLTQHQDVGIAGNPSVAGSASFANGVYTVTGSGSDIWDTADHMQYLYRPLTGDGQIIARVVTEQAGVNDFAKAGVMFRDSLDAGATNAYMLQFPNPGSRGFPTYQWRAATGGSTADHEVSGAVQLPVWLRLVRSGNVFIGYWARDMNGAPGTWNQLGAETAAMGSTALVGLAVTSHQNGQTVTATFDHVQIIPAVPLAKHLNITVTPTGVTPGGSVSVTVQALDPLGNPATDYTGTVHFTSSDPAAKLPADYPFVAADHGMHTFTVTLNTVGTQSITVTDAAAGISATQSNILVSFPLNITSLTHSAFGINEGGQITVNGQFTDPLAGQAHTAVIAWGDGSAGTTLTLPAGVFSFSANHQYLEEGDFGIRVTVQGAVGVSETLTLPVTPAGLVSWWSGEGNAADVADNNPGTLNGNVSFAPGKVGKAFSFDGNNSSYVNVPDATNLDGNTGTWSFWLKTTQTSGFVGLVGKSDSSGSVNGITMQMDQGHARVEVKGNGPTTLLTGTTTLNDGQWHLMTLTFQSGGPVVLYVDGKVEKSDTAVAFTFNPNPLRFGRMTDGFWTAYNGLLDDVQVYNRALSAGEVQALYNPAAVVPPSGLVDWWTGDGNNPTTAPDIAGTNAGALSGGVTYAPGEVGNAFSFNGASNRTNYVNIPDAPSLNSTTGTWDFWVKTTQSGSFVGFVGKADANTSLNGLIMQMDPTGLPRLEIKNASQTTLLTGTTHLNDGQWHNFALSFQSGGPMVMYVDGQVQATGTAPVFTFNPNPMRFGTQLDTFWAPYNGLLDEVQIYNKVLPAGDIQSIFNAGSAGLVKGVHASDPAVVPTGGFTVVSYAGAISSMQTVGVFTDPGGPEGLADYSATINWGDNTTPSAGVISFNSATNVFTVQGNHAYSAVGIYPVTVTLRHDTAANVTATSAALVFPPVLHLAGFPSPTGAGTPGNFMVTVQDPFGGTLSGYRGTVHFTSSDSQADLPADYVFTAADAGTHTFSATLKTAGTQSLTATDTATASSTSTQAGIQVNPAAASTLVVIGYPSPTTAGTAGNFTVTVYDPYGNVATGYTGTVTFSSSDGQAGLPDDYAFTTGPGGDNGVHTFSATLKTAGAQSLTVTDILDPTLTDTQDGILVNPANAVLFLVAGYPSPTVKGEAHAFTVTAYDAYGNVATGYTGTVHFTSSDNKAALPIDYTFTAEDGGVHTFSATFERFGFQSLTVTDILDPTLTGTQDGILVVNKGKGK
jgi:hypothetical protein